MLAGGWTPEELETLMEDACVLGDGKALSHLFEARGVLVLGPDRREAHGRIEIAESMELLAGTTGSGYIALPRLVYQNNDIALLLGEGVINVARRSPDRSWLFAISLMTPQLTLRSGDQRRDA